MTDLITLRSQTDEIYQTYASNFAGRARATRDPQLLEQLIARLEGAIDSGRKILSEKRDPAVLQLVDGANENLERYLDELSAIRSVQGDPRAVFAAELAEQANRIFDQYQRHFAGEDRGTRDYLLLNFLADELNAIEQKMAQLEEAGVQQTIADRKSVVDQLTLYRNEIANIKEAQKSGSTEDQANRLAQLANAQFASYQTHFAGKSRRSRSLLRLQRMSDNLKAYQREMRRIHESGLRSEMNAQNIQVISNNLEMYAKERGEIEAARAEVSVRDLAGALGGAANQTFEQYRENFAGKNRGQVDAELLSGICDELFDIAYQMREISDEIDVDMNEQNLKIVDENLAAYEREYRAVRDAQNS